MKRIKRAGIYFMVLFIIFSGSFAFSGCDDRKDITIYICVGYIFDSKSYEDCYSGLDSIEYLRPSQAVRILQAFNKTGAIGKTKEMLAGNPIKPSDIVIPPSVEFNRYVIDCDTVFPRAFFIRYQIEGNSQLYAIPYSADPYFRATVQAKSGVAQNNFSESISYIGYLITEPGEYVFRMRIDEKHEKYNPIDVSFTVIAKSTE